jgi:hypothetical protein
MRVVGGIYQERCFLPRWNQIFGSAGRAACVISTIFRHKPILSGWYSKRGVDALNASFGPYGIRLNIRTGRSHYTFVYAHPLSRPDCYRSGPPDDYKWRNITDEVVLVFGAIEGLPSIRAEKLILDPQGGDLFELLESGILSARQIAIVANEREIAIGPGSNMSEKAQWILTKYPQVTVVIVKRGPFGATVFLRRRVEKISAYESRKVFKIGSGDVFSAVFAFMWGSRGEDSALSADFASRTVACYVDDPYLNFTRADISRPKPFVPRRRKAQLYLAAPFFTVSDFLMLADVRRSLSELGCDVFSPFHHVGYGEPKAIVAKDLRGLADSECVLALLQNNDPGSLFETGYARAKGIPVVVVAENAKGSDATMLAGSGCIISRHGWRLEPADVRAATFWWHRIHVSCVHFAPKPLFDY